LNRYPDPAAHELKQQLQQSMQVPTGYDVLLGNGSDELIQMILMAVSGPDRVVLAPEPGFVMYKMIATFLHMPYVGVPLRREFTLDTEAMLTAIAQHHPAVIFLAYPNNPTGNLFDDDSIEAIIQATDGLVVIDEAYHAFAGKTWMDRMSQFDNVLVMRTVSKMGLAGLRLGLLAGHPRWLNEFDKVRLPYNINVLTQASAKFALQHQSVLAEQTVRIKQDRERLLSDLKQLKGLEVFPSQANFILFRTPAGKAASVFETLKLHKVLIKNLSHAGGLLADCLRVTVGTPDENAAFMNALRLAL
jgi:histidinol-phosphate aminotransferase